MRPPVCVCVFLVFPLAVVAFATRVDVLSKPFDAITRALLERQGLRRLIGFMGAAAVAAASDGKQNQMLRITLHIYMTLLRSRVLSIPAVRVQQQ